MKPDYSMSAVKTALRRMKGEDVEPNNEESAIKELEKLVKQNDDKAAGKSLLSQLKGWHVEAKDMEKVLVYARENKVDVEYAAKRLRAGDFKPDYQSIDSHKRNDLGDHIKDFMEDYNATQPKQVSKNPSEQLKEWQTPEFWEKHQAKMGIVSKHYDKNEKPTDLTKLSEQTAKVMSRFEPTPKTETHSTEFQTKMNSVVERFKEQSQADVSAPVEARNV